MKLESTKSNETIDGFVANFQLGLYDLEGNWQSVDVPSKFKAEVARTQEEFSAKLEKVLKERFELQFTLDEESEAFV